MRIVDWETLLGGGNMEHPVEQPGSAPFDAIDAYIERQMRRLRLPGVALAVVEDGRIVHQRGFGRAGPDGAPPIPQTPFYIGSLTKSFTALAVMQLAEAGRIELDAPVRRYLPWFRVADARASAAITVRHLLNQTSGLPTSAGEIPLADFDAGPDAAERQMRALATLQLRRPPGAAFEYSNANYNLLGLIIEATAGESYARYVERHVFAPLGMSHATTDPAVAGQNGLAVGHRYWFAAPVAAPDIPVAHGSLAGGMLLASADDMARYLIAMLNGGRVGDGQLLSPAGVAELHRGAAEVAAYGLKLGRYAMGWYDTEIGGTRLLWHSGILPHFFAYMALLPERNRGVVLLGNADSHWMSPVLMELGTGAAALLAGVEPPSLPVVGLIPWLLRGLLLIPLLQVIGLVAGWRLWRGRPPSGDKRASGVALPLMMTLAPALSLKPLLSRRRGYLRLYMPDYYWIALISGGLAAAGTFLHMALLLRALRRKETAHRGALLRGK